MTATATLSSLCRIATVVAMVLYSNVNLNQRVELLYEDQLLRGTVKYKGAVNNLDGEWVGLALDQPYGKHNGLYKGRRYFECMSSHGVFVRAGKIRFIQSTKRSLFNKYYRSYDTGVDENLFGFHNKPVVENGPNDPIYIDRSRYDKTGGNNDLFDTLGSRYNSNKFGLTGSISRQLPAATMTRPMTAASAFTYTSTPVQSRRRPDKEAWEPVPSIPKAHMPHSAQIKQTRRGWDSAHWTRELSVPTARQNMKRHTWNDVSF